MTTKDNGTRGTDSKLLYIRVFKIRDQILSYAVKVMLKFLSDRWPVCHFTSWWPEEHSSGKLELTAELLPASSSAISALLISHPSLCSRSHASPLLRPVMCFHISFIYLTPPHTHQNHPHLPGEKHYLTSVSIHEPSSLIHTLTHCPMCHRKI